MNPSKHVLDLKPEPAVETPPSVKEISRNRSDKIIQTNYKMKL